MAQPGARVEGSLSLIDKNQAATERFHYNHISGFFMPEWTFFWSRKAVSGRQNLQFLTCFGELPAIAGLLCSCMTLSPSASARRIACPFLCLSGGLYLTL